MDKTRRTVIAAIAASLVPVSLARAQQGADAGYTTLQSALPVEIPAVRGPLGPGESTGPEPEWDAIVRPAASPGGLQPMSAPEKM